MADDNRISDEVDKTLASFDHDAALEGNPFLWTRIQRVRARRLQKRTGRFFVHVSLVKVAIAFVFLINAITVVHYFDWNKEYAMRQELILALKSDFQIVQSQDPF